MLVAGCWARGVARHRTYTRTCNAHHDAVMLFNERRRLAAGIDQTVRQHTSLFERRDGRRSKGVRSGLPVLGTLPRFRAVIGMNAD